MLHLAKLNVTPPGGYRYIDPDTEQKFKESHMQKLVAAVTAHRNANELPLPPNLRATIEDWICKRCPPGICKNDSGHLVRHGTAHKTAETTVRSTQLLHRLAKRSGGKRVSQSVAEARARRCVECSFNLPFAGCMSCRGVGSILKSLKGRNKTSLDAKLLSCGVCGVLNQIHVFVDDDTLIETAGKLGDYPGKCWKRQLVKGARKDGRKVAAGDGDSGRSRSSQDSGSTVIRTKRAGVDNKRGRSRRKSSGCGCGSGKK